MPLIALYRTGHLQCFELDASRQQFDMVHFGIHLTFSLPVSLSLCSFSFRGVFRAKEAGVDSLVHSSKRVVVLSYRNKLKVWYFSAASGVKETVVL